MTVGELIKLLADYSPDTFVATLDGNLITSGINGSVYSDEAMGTDIFDEVNDGAGMSGNTLYLLTD